MHKLPKVVIVGRTNVGKSTLFNRLSESVKSLVLDYEGVTRDFVKDAVSWQGNQFWLIDSGGISLKKSKDSLVEQVRQLGLELLKDADLILFVVDGTVGLTAEDSDIGSLLHKLEKRVIVLINKIDNFSAREYQYQFNKLGFASTITISAQHGTGIADLLDSLVAALPKKESDKETEKSKLRAVILGKPNVGKSSLMNLLLDQERVLVSEIAGTTREAISEPVKFYQETFTITDTPGIRRKRKIEDPLEKMMIRTAFRAVDTTDIVLLMVDGSEGELSDQELKLAFYALDQGKALVLLINKVDLVTEDIKEVFGDQFDRYPQFFKKVPHLFISCKSQKNVGKILPLIGQVWQRYNQKFSIEKLTTIFKEALRKKPLYSNGQLLKVKMVKQISAAPITLLLRVNDQKLFGPSHLAFFENRLRKELDLLGVPVMFEVRKG